MICPTAKLCDGAQSSTSPRDVVMGTICFEETTSFVGMDDHGRAVLLRIRSGSCHATGLCCTCSSATTYHGFGRNVSLSTLPWKCVVCVTLPFSLLSVVDEGAAAAATP